MNKGPNFDIADREHVTADSDAASKLFGLHERMAAEYTSQQPQRTGPKTPVFG